MLPVQGGRFVRPSPRSPYTYTASGASPAQLATPCFGPLGKTPTVTALGTSGRVRRGARGLGLSPAPCAAAPVVFAAIRAAMLRRRDTGFSPCDVSHRASDEPRRRMSLSSALAPSSLASPSTRRVFLRSLCARRRSVSELNFCCGKSVAMLSTAILHTATLSAAALSTATLSTATLSDANSTLSDSKRP